MKQFLPYPEAKPIVYFGSFSILSALKFSSPHWNISSVAHSDFLFPQTEKSSYNAPNTYLCPIPQIGFSACELEDQNFFHLISYW